MCYFKINQSFSNFVLVFSAIFIYIKKLNKFSLNGSIFNFFIFSYFTLTNFISGKVY